MGIEYLRFWKTIYKRLEDAHDPVKSPIRAEFLNAENEFLCWHIKGGRALIAGSGLGHDSFALGRTGIEVVGAELIFPLAMMSRKTAQLQNVTNVRVINANFTCLPIKDGSFDAAILNMGTLGTIRNQVRAMRELLRVAKIVYADVYDKSKNADEVRRRMYRQEGWVHITVNRSRFKSRDGLDSRGFSRRDIEDLAKRCAASVEIFRLNSSAFMCSFKENNRESSQQEE